MATFHRVMDFNKHLLYGLHDFVSYNYKLALTNYIDEDISSYDDVVEISEAGGYVKGGYDVPLRVEEGMETGIITVYTEPEFEIDFPDKTDEFRYAFLYTPDNKHKPIVCYWDYGESTSLDNELLKFKFGNNGKILSIL